MVGWWSQLQNFATSVDCDFGGKVALGNRRGNARDIAHLVGQVAGHVVDAIRQAAPGSRHAFHFRLPAEPSFRSHFARHARHFGSE